jgi:hypothetical protein
MLEQAVHGSQITGSRIPDHVVDHDHVHLASCLVKDRIATPMTSSDDGPPSLGITALNGGAEMHNNKSINNNNTIIGPIYGRYCNS